MPRKRKSRANVTSRAAEAGAKGIRSKGVKNAQGFATTGASNAARIRKNLANSKMSGLDVVKSDGSRITRSQARRMLGEIRMGRRGLGIRVSGANANQILSRATVKGANAAKRRFMVLKLSVKAAG